MIKPIKLSLDKLINHSLPKLAKLNLLILVWTNKRKLHLLLINVINMVK